MSPGPDDPSASDRQRPSAVSGGRRAPGTVPPGPALYVLLGDPVDHSASPALQKAAFEALGIDAAYVALRVGGDELEPVMRAVGRQGGGNVTVPHKRRAAAAVDAPAASVRATGACNCFWGEGDGRLHGDNTDVEAFVQASRTVRSDGPERARVLLLGAGGAARAVLYGALSADARSVHVLNRTVARARRMVEDVAGEASDDAARVRVLRGPQEAAGPYDLAVNATSLGLAPADPLPLELAGRQVGGVLDLVYGPEDTPWVRHAAELGIPARDGTEMLVLQAAASIGRWTGRRPPLEPLWRTVRLHLRGNRHEVGEAR